MSYTLIAQRVNLEDSLSHVFKLKPVPTAKLDSRDSFIGGKYAGIRGVKAGLAFGNRLTLGVGYSWLKKDFTVQRVIDHNLRDAEIQLRYFGPFIEYSFYKKGPWEATIPLQIGFGKSFYRVKELGASNRYNEGSVMLYEPAMTIEYKVLKIFGFGIGVGYRIMLKNNRAIDEQFTSPIYVLKARIIFDELYKMVKS